MSGEYTPLLANDPAVVVIFFNEPSSMELMTQTNRNQNNNEKQTSRDKQTDTKLIQDTRFNSDQKLNDIVELLNNFRQHPFMTLDSVDTISIQFHPFLNNSDNNHLTDQRGLKFYMSSL